MKVAIISLKFSPGHIAHLRAYRELFLCLNAEAALFLAPEYKNYMSDLKEIIYTAQIEKIISWKPDLAFLYNISIDNLALASACRKNNFYSVYVLHEPRGSFKELLAEGHDLVKTLGANIVNSLICRRVDKVLLASQTGMRNYTRYMRSCNSNYALFPLIFKDEYDQETEIQREYFSFIGAFTDVHACNEFMKFMKWALREKPDIKFLIATKDDISVYADNELIKNALQAGKLVVQSGKPMTTAEINTFYRKSICVWNAYNRSTQSGVLPNAFMQGTPVIVNHNDAAKDVFEDKTAGCYITRPLNNADIFRSYQYIRDHLADMSECARDLFRERYWYGSFIEEARVVFSVSANHDGGRNR